MCPRDSHTPGARLDKAFLGTTLKARFIEKKPDEFDFIKMENFCSLKDTVKKIRRQATDWKKVFLQNTHLIKEFYPECIKNPRNSIIRKQTTQLKIGKRVEKTPRPTRWQISTW